MYMTGAYKTNVLDFVKPEIRFRLLCSKKAKSLRKTKKLSVFVQFVLFKIALVLNILLTERQKKKQKV